MSYRSDLEDIINDRLRREKIVKFRVDGNWERVLARTLDGEYMTFDRVVSLDSADMVASAEEDYNGCALYLVLPDCKLTCSTMNTNAKRLVAPSFIFHYNKYELKNDI